MTASRRPRATEVLDGAGRHLFPGFVDPHVHLRTPGQEHKEDLDSGTRAAAAGGFVAVVAMPNTDPTVDSAPVLKSLIEQARREARVPVGFMASITRGLAGEALTEMAELKASGALGFTDDGKPVAHAAILQKALQYQRLVGGVLALHEEDPSLSGAGVMHEGTVSARLGLAGIPSVSESTMIARDAALAKYEEGRIHIQHLSARESVEAIREAKARGVQITCEASPHHLTLTHEVLLEKLDTRCKMNPPLREETDRQALIEGLRDGTVDCIATDHAPHAREEKDVPFEVAPMGTTGLETSFAAVHTELVRPGVLPLELVVDKLSSGAATVGPRAAADRRRRAGEPDAGRPRRRVGGGGGRLRVALGELLLRRPDAAGQGARDHRRRRGRLPGARVRGERRMTGYVMLADGTTFEGDLVGAAGEVTGEVVFTTGMSGYQESVTDPSFNSQIITFTYPHVGNYGVSEAAMESDRIHARAVIMREAMNRADAPSATSGLARLAGGERHHRHHRGRHPGARPPHPRRGRHARRDLLGGDERLGGTRARRRRADAWSAATSPARSRSPSPPRTGTAAARA